MIDIFTEYAWVKSLKNKKAKTVLHGFNEILKNFQPKPNKLIKEKNFIIAPPKIDWMIMIF